MAAGALAAVGNALSMLGVPAFHRMPTFRRSVVGYALVAVAATQAMPRVDKLVDLKRLNTLIAFFRNFFCMWKDLYPAFLTRFWPRFIPYTPLTCIVAVHQYIGGCLFNVYLGGKWFLEQREEKTRLTSWQELARKLSRQGFADLVKDSGDEEKKLGSKASARKAAKGIAAVEGRRIVEDEIDYELSSVGAGELQAGCRWFIGMGFFYLASMGVKVSGFAALCRGITVMLSGLAIILVNAAGRVTDEMKDLNDTIAAAQYLLGELAAGTPPPTLVAPEHQQGIEKSSRRLRLLGALVQPDDSGHADDNAAARPWRWDWAVRRASRISQVPKPTGESLRAAVVLAERRGDEMSAAAAKATLEEEEVPLKAGAQCWVLPDESASESKGSSAAVSGSKRRAMLVIDNEDGTWNVVYNVRDPERVWQEDEVRQRPVLCHFILKRITLPRQARHKHKETVFKRAFSCRTRRKTLQSTGS
jgi:hypothetical protein